MEKRAGFKSKNTKVNDGFRLGHDLFRSCDGLIRPMAINKGKDCHNPSDASAAVANGYNRPPRPLMPYS